MLPSSSFLSLGNDTEVHKQITYARKKSHIYQFRRKNVSVMRRTTEILVKNA